ncbi:MAG TPA: hypothetical protein VIR78_02305 [Malonomonas sp.]
MYEKEQVNYNRTRVLQPLLREQTQTLENKVTERTFALAEKMSS